LTTIGKNEIKNAVSTAGIARMPNQITRIGTIVTLGMLLKPGAVPAAAQRGLFSPSPFV
jgi:hypothetical protein